jgi:hypothetical protein
MNTKKCEGAFAPVWPRLIYPQEMKDILIPILVLKERLSLDSLSNDRLTVSSITSLCVWIFEFDVFQEQYCKRNLFYYLFDCCINYNQNIAILTIF